MRKRQEKIIYKQMFQKVQGHLLANIFDFKNVNFPTARVQGPLKGPGSSMVLLRCSLMSSESYIEVLNLIIQF